MKYVWQSKLWPNFTWDTDKILTLLSRVRKAQGHLLGQITNLGLNLGEEAHQKIITEETIKTAAIEGEHLNPLSVRSSVVRQLGLDAAGLPAPERHVDGLVSVLLDASRQYNKPLTLARIKGWQAALFPTGYSGFNKIRVGEWRKNDPMQIVSGPVGREKIHFEAPPSVRISGEMKNFLVWWNKTKNNSGMDGLIRAAIAHFYFVTIHPFDDGNGRLARAITDMAIAADEKTGERYYSLSSQIMNDRDGYYAALEKSSKGNGDITGWIVWFLSCLEKAIEKSEEITKNVLQKNLFWKKFATSSINGRQRKVLNRLLDDGEEALGGLTTRKYVSLTKASRATAYREIDDLVTLGMLVANKGAGRNVSYRVMLDSV